MLATATATVSQPAVAAAAPVAPARNRRIVKMHDMAELFPECPGISRSLAARIRGFAEPGSLVPTRNPRFIQEAAFLEEFTYFNQCPTEFMVALTGPTGCGKTERVLDYYSRLNIPVFQKAGFGDMKPYDIIGSKELRGKKYEVSGPGGASNEVVIQETPMEYGPLCLAMKYGYPFLLDEGFKLSARITSKFHTIRDRGELMIDETGEVIVAKPGFKFIITSNQRGYGDDTGFYLGDAEQDLAFLNGICSIECDYPAFDVEVRIVRETLEAAHPAFATEPILQEIPVKMVQVATAVRSQFAGNESNASTVGRVEIAISTRTLVKWANSFVAFRGSSNSVHPLYRSLDFVAMRKGCSATRAFVDAVVLEKFAIKRDDKDVRQ